MKFTARLLLAAAVTLTAAPAFSADLQDGPPVESKKSFRQPPPESVESVVDAGVTQLTEDGFAVGLEVPLAGPAAGRVVPVLGPSHPVRVR